MASAWGDSWSTAWADSWGLLVAAGGGGGGGLRPPWPRARSRSLLFPITPPERQKRQQPTSATYTDVGTLTALVSATIGGREWFTVPSPVVPVEKPRKAAPVVAPIVEPTAYHASGDLTAIVSATIDGRAYFIDRARQLREDNAIIRAAVLGLDIGKALERV